MEWQGHMVGGIYLTLKETSNAFPEWFVLLYISTNISSTPLSTFGISSLFSLKNYDSCVMVSHCEHNLHFPEHSHIFKCLFKLCPGFKNWFLVFLLKSKCFYNIFWIQVLL